jgi:two-component system CheB/CheR fusion protein
LGEILARYSNMPVLTVIDRAPLQAGTIYVIPSDRNVEVSGHVLRLQVDGPGRRPMPSINLLLSSAARAFGERLIAVILTGTGSDGASGAYQVKAAGGLVIIENPETAPTQPCRPRWRPPRWITWSISSASGRCSTRS